METYFHSDPRIEEWVDQITEKIFTVCLLTGADSEVEFQRGSQIVSKVAHLLQDIAVFPSEYLEDGLKQLLQQQLPDSRVINNFPTFQDTMTKMLREGLTRAIDAENKENLRIEPSNKLNTFPIVEAKINCNENTERSAVELKDESVTEQVTAALASINSTTSNLWDSQLELQFPILDIPIAKSKDISSIIALPIVTPTSTPTKPFGIIRKTQRPEQADRLKHVLGNIFPNVAVCWNLNLMGQTFLAQVEDILICLHNPELPCQVENLNKEGWKVYVCNADDLLYPRRLERGIRQIKRLGKLCIKR